MSALPGGCVCAAGNVLGCAHTKFWQLHPALSREGGKGKDVPGWGQGLSGCPGEGQTQPGLVCPVPEEGKELPFHPSPGAGAATAPPGVGRAPVAAGKESLSICSCFKAGAEERKQGPAPGTEHTAPGPCDAEGEGIFKTNV